MSLPDTLALSIAQPCPHCAKPVQIMEFRFPTSMYEPSGQLEYRLMRSKFLQQMADLFDRNAEAGRQECIKLDPQTVRPPLEKLGMAIVNVATVATMEPEEVLGDDAESA